MARETEIIYGIHAVRHALQQRPESVLELWVLEGRGTHESVQIAQLAARAGVNVQQASKSTLERLVSGAVHQGVAARIRGGNNRSPADLDTILAATEDQQRLFLVLDGVQDPHNLGACLRTANAAGVDAVILPKDRAAAITPVVRKVASGAAEVTPVITVTNISRTLARLQEANVWIIGADGSAQHSLYDLDLNISLAIVLGAEGEGLRQNTRNHCDFLAGVPMLGTVESLNVSVATGIFLYETVRQRNSRSKK